MTQLSLPLGAPGGHGRVDAVTLAAALGRQHPPTPEQARAIEHLGPAGRPVPVLIVAGAGSGKTETMASRVVWLVANGIVRPERVLGLTFTKKAAGELADRVTQRLTMLGRAGLLGPEAADLFAGTPTISTYHAYAARLFVEHATRIGREPAARLLGEAATWQLAGRVAAGYDGAMDDVPWTVATVTARVRSQASDLAEHLLEPAELMTFIDEVEAQVRALPRAVGQQTKGSDHHEETRNLLQGLGVRRQLIPIVEAYARLKQRADALDYGDQVALAARIAVDHPVVGGLERTRYDLVLLDEYQDTGHAQRMLLTSLFGGGHAVTAVGDPCQSIYGWRGASAGNLRSFPRDFPTEEDTAADVLDLRTSFRNGGRILQVANALSEPLRAHGVPVADLVPGPKGASSGRVVTAIHRTVDDEAGWLAGTIAGLLAGAERTYAPHDVAVLCRRRAQFQAIETALRAHGVPVEVSGLGGLLARPEVVDVVATLRVLTDAAEGAAAARILTGSRWLLGPRDLQALGDRARFLTRLDRLGITDADAETEVAVSKTELDPDHVDERSLVEAIDSPGRAEAYSPAGYARLRHLGDELRGLRRRLDQPLPDLIGDVIRTLRLDVEVATSAGADASVARGHLDRLIDVAAEFAETDDDPTVRSFLAYLLAAEDYERGLDTGRVGVPGDAVQLLTVHGAKGLEWPVVVVPGLYAGSFPSTGQSTGDWCSKSADALPFPLRGDRNDLPALDISACTDQAELRAALQRHHDAVGKRALLEERRLMYVAVTRAEDLLICSTYWWDHTTKLREPSPFWNEVVAAADRGGFGQHGPDEPRPAPDAVSPLNGLPQTHPWPYELLSEPRRVALHEAAMWIADFKLDETATETRDAASPGVPLPGQVRLWQQTADRLLAERARDARHLDVIDVALPAHLAVSQLVALRADPDELARNLRRPVPAAPAPLARRGTAFHAWLEQRFGGGRLLDLDELPGSADDGAAPDSDLALLKQRFLESEWAERTPIEVEVPFDTIVAGLVVRGRMDAVFVDGLDGFEIVDWKTGQPPTGARRPAAAVQLAAYRLAWHRLTQVPLDRIKAAFHYVRDGHTERPVDLLEEAGLTALITELPSQVDVDDERGVVGEREPEHAPPAHGPAW